MEENLELLGARKTQYLLISNSHGQAEAALRLSNEAAWESETRWSQKKFHDLLFLFDSSILQHSLRAKHVIYR